MIDAGTSRYAPIADPAPPAPAQPPSPPVLTPCPNGWREVAGSGTSTVVTCDPWPEGGAKTCPSGWAHFPGDPDCSLIGSACPSGQFSDQLPSSRTIHYVLAGAASGGDGSAAAPFSTIAEALMHSRVGDGIALSKGTHRGFFYLPDEVALFGACPDQTVITSSVSSGVYIGGAGSEIHNIQIRGRPAIFIDHPSASTDLQGVLIDQSTDTGILMFGGTITGTSVVIVNVEPYGPDAGRGIDAQSASRLSLHRAVIANNRQSAVFAYGVGTAVELSCSAIVDTRSTTSRTGGVGVYVAGGARVELRRTALERNRQTAFVIDGTGTIMNAADSVVRDTAADEGTGTKGHGAAILDGAGATFTRVLFERNALAAVLATGGAEVQLSHTVIRDTKPQQIDRTAGIGLAVVSSRVDVASSLIYQNRFDAILAGGQGTMLHMVDVEVSDTAPDVPHNLGGPGLELLDGAKAAMERCRFARNRTAGISVSSTATFTATDLIVIDTAADALTSMAGDGLFLDKGISGVDITRALFERNQATSVFTSTNVSMKLRDVMIRDTMMPSGFQAASGLVSVQSQIHLERALFEGNAGDCILMYRGSALDACDIVVRDTGSVGALGFGVGLRLLADSTATITRARFEANHGIGLALSSTCGAVLEDLAIVDTQGDDTSKLWGRAIEIEYRSHVTLRRALIARNRETAIAVYHPGSSLTLEQVSILDTMPAACAADSCSGFGLGIGIGAYSGASMIARTFEIGGSAFGGIQLANGGVADLHDGEVYGSPLGANIQTDGFDVARLEDGVMFHDNARNIDRRPLATPRSF
jgi:hypothetical protein